MFAAYLAEERRPLSAEYCRYRTLEPARSGVQKPWSDG